MLVVWGKNSNIMKNMKSISKMKLYIKYIFMNQAINFRFNVFTNEDVIITILTSEIIITFVKIKNIEKSFNFFYNS